MRVRFILGPAGGGKTFRCLAGIREALANAPDGPPLLLIAPKQATFQLERQLLADPDLPGHTRLRILSFERLAEFILDQLHRPPTRLLNDEGRVMVLRALLERHRDDLKLFRATARLPGLSRQLSALLRELGRYHITINQLDELADKPGAGSQLEDKLRDLALLMRAYRDWLREHELQDADSLLDLARESLPAVLPATKKKTREAGQLMLSFDSAGENDSLEAASRASSPELPFSGLWLDGFAEMTAQEISLLTALIPHCDSATLAFCLEQKPADDLSWLSTWSVVAQTFRNCHSSIAVLPGVNVSVEVLRRDTDKSRFADSPGLRHLEEYWTDPKPFPCVRPDVKQSSGPPMTGIAGPPGSTPPSAHPSPGKLVEDRPTRIVQCASPETEAVFAAREILRAVRDRGMRYRDIAVLLRSLDSHADVLRRTFARYDIPCFLDRRESAAHHPLAELTRGALRTVAFGWRHADWFGALKSGFVPLSDDDLDWLENEALARGWVGEKWHQPLLIPDDPERTDHLNQLRVRLLPPFAKLLADFDSAQFKLNGVELAGSIRQLWSDLRVEETLDRWSFDERDGVSPSATESSNPVHQTVHEQMRAWLDNLERAFAAEQLSLREWLPILESGLSNLTVGVIPPSLDQVLIGAIDRSRNPDLQMVLLPGMNETLFPATPPHPALLTEADREAMSEHGVDMGMTRRQQIGHERYYGYIACTRARRRLTVSFSGKSTKGEILNRSSFVDRLEMLFPGIPVESFRPSDALESYEHRSEIIAPLLQSSESTLRNCLPHYSMPPEIVRLRDFDPGASLSTALPEQLYGSIIRTSVSQIEQFAACPFRFYVSAGLRAGERERFEVDARQGGSFQHEVLAAFHAELTGQGRRWRDLTPGQAEDLIGRIATRLAVRFGNGLFGASPRNRFQATALTLSLRRFIHTIVGWMESYRFDPVQVEIGFGRRGSPLPPWELDLGEGHKLSFRGIIDRVDVAAGHDGGPAFCVVVDYKSSIRKIDPLLLEHGIQIQLPAYLAVLNQLDSFRSVFGADRLIPAGVFYVNLRGVYPGGRNRLETIEDSDDIRRSAYQHQGRFRLDALPQLDASGASGESKSGQFNYRLTKDGEPHKNSHSVMKPDDFQAMLDQIESQLRRMGEAIYQGEVAVDPYLKGRSTACDWCDYRSICRIDPWTHRYRVLRAGEAGTGEGTD